MPKEEWGVKRVCPTTGRRFYDLNKSPIISPYTGEVVEIDLSGRKGPAANAAPALDVTKAKAPVPLDSEDDLLVEDDGADVDIDNDLLEDDEEDNVALDDIADVAGDDDEG